MVSKKIALITGIAGQDGSYLAELLLAKGYEVHGGVKEKFSGPDDPRAFRLAPIFERLTIHECDVAKEEHIERTIREIVPDEIYHLASDVEPRVLFEEEGNIFKVNFESARFILRAVKRFAPRARAFIAGSSLMFGNPETMPQNERTPLNPTTPYGIAKTAAYHLARMYRYAHGVYACTGILYNHESPRRDEKFLIRKITKAAARIAKGLDTELMLGNIDAKRDWGFAGDFVEAMWLMLQQSEPEDFVIGTGQLHSVRDVLALVFEKVGLKWENYVKIDKALFRKDDPVTLVADPTKAKEKLGWKSKTTFEDLIQMMVDEDLRLIEPLDPTYD
jgi:GDPmannose 4,6-dehydratase